jgi:hypothetical protein
VTKKQKSQRKIRKAELRVERAQFKKFEAADLRCSVAVLESSIDNRIKNNRYRASCLSAKHSSKPTH